MRAALLIILASHASATTFNITYLFVPEVVLHGQKEVDIECRYDADFTIMSWFKGPSQFFRYTPATVPSVRSYSILGVGNIDVLECGPSVCRLRLSSLTEEASGSYHCDIERETPPYMFMTKEANMRVHGVNHRKPLLQGMADEYGEGDEIEAYCRGAKGSELRWYVNGAEVINMRDSAMFKMSSSKFLFKGVPPTVSVQCAEFRNKLLLGSKEVKAKWRDFKDASTAPTAQVSTCAGVTLAWELLFGLSVMNLVIGYNNK